MPGTLYVVATPIGNLGDITHRGIQVLKDVDLIACEDTRHTRKLLQHFGINTKTISYHDHNEESRSKELIGQLTDGSNVALVSDAGTSTISDPGFRLVSKAVEEGIAVIPIPGPSALISAIIASGLPTDEFLFAGFLSARSGQRRTRLAELRNVPATLIFYEAPHRLIESLEDVVDVLGPTRHVVIAREVTKIYEEFVRGQARDVLAEMKLRDEVRGEITLLIGKEEDQGAPVLEQKNVRQRIRDLMKSEGLDEKDAMKRLAKEMGVSKSEVYREMQKGK